MRQIRRFCRQLLPALVFGLSLPLSAAATAPPSAATPPAMTAPDIEAFADGVIGLGIAEGDIAGGVVVVVADGRVLLAKGYGFADVKSGRRVDPERTMFRIASISKTVNALVVMQLVEQGKLDLDADIQRYLDFKVPRDRFQAPITLRHLLTHTAGFEDSFRLSAIEVPQQLPALGPFLRETMPARVNPPGQRIAYSNYGSALAGYIAQRAAGQSWDSLVEARVFAPLGMTYSSPRQPLPPRLLPHATTGYTVASAPPGGFELIGDAPAGAISASGADMARYMIALLEQGKGPGPALVSPAGFDAMFTTQHRPHPRLWGPGLAFLVQPQHGERIVWHNGGTNYSGSDMRLLLDRGIGVFSVFNSAGGTISGGGLSNSFWQAFRDRYLPVASPVFGPAPATAAADAAAVAGTYLPTRRAVESFAALLNLAGGYTLTAAPDGTLRFLSGLGGAPREWRPVGPLLWQQAGGEAMLAATRDDEGKVFKVAQDFSEFDRVRGINNPEIAQPMALAGLAVLLVALVAWTWRGMVRIAGGPATWMPWLSTRLTTGLGLASLTGFALAVSGVGTAAGGLIADNAALMIALRVGTLLIPAGAALALVEMALPGPKPGRARAALFVFAVGGLTLSLVLWRFRLFGFSGQY